MSLVQIAPPVEYCYKINPEVYCVLRANEEKEMKDLIVSNSIYRSGKSGYKSLRKYYNSLLYKMFTLIKLEYNCAIDDCVYKCLYNDLICDDYEVDICYNNCLEDPKTYDSIFDSDSSCSLPPDAPNILW